MIHRISVNEYLRRYDNMDAAERQAYIGRVGQWLGSGGRKLAVRTECFAAGLQDAVTVSASWNDEECLAFEEGARLLSALAGKADTWLPDMLYVKSARRSVKRMFCLLWEIEKAGGDVPAAEMPKEDLAGETRKGTQGVGAPDGDGVRMQAGAAKEAPLTGAGAAPVRPRHVDQYAHLLPQKTQEHAAQLRGLYRELEDARRKMGLLAEDRTASPADREAWAKKATAADSRIRKILDELDREWARLVKEGRVVVDDLGNARTVEAAGDEGRSGEPAAMTSEDRARRRSIRKWLVDTRRGNGDGENRAEHVIRWQENFEELWRYDGDKVFEDTKVLAAAAHYGIDIKRPDVK